MMTSSANILPSASAADSDAAAVEKARSASSSSVTKSPGVDGRGCRDALASAAMRRRGTKVRMAASLPGHPLRSSLQGRNDRNP